LLICGLPPTLLYNLLACDSNCRAPLYTDMCIQIVPPIARSNSIEQTQLSVKQKEHLTGSQSQIAASHPSFPFEEDYNILIQASFLPFFTSIVCDDYDTWLQKEMAKD